MGCGPSKGLQACNLPVQQDQHIDPAMKQAFTAPDASVISNGELHSDEVTGKSVHPASQQDPIHSFTANSSRQTSLTLPEAAPKTDSAVSPDAADVLDLAAQPLDQNGQPADPQQVANTRQEACTDQQSDASVDVTISSETGTDSSCAPRAATGPEAPTQSTSAVLGSSKPAEAGTVAEQVSPWTYLQKTYSQNRGMEQGSHAHIRKAAGKAASQSQLLTRPPPVQEGQEEQPLPSGLSSNPVQTSYHKPPGKAWSDLAVSPRQAPADREPFRQLSAVSFQEVADDLGMEDVADFDAELAALHTINPDHIAT